MGIRTAFRKFMDRVGYYCHECGKYRKVFRPPCTPHACLSCQLKMSDMYLKEVRILAKERILKPLSVTEYAEKMVLLRKKYMPDNTGEWDEKQDHRKTRDVSCLQEGRTDGK